MEDNWVLFIIGPTASGKTTIGKKLFAELNKYHHNLIFYDGDDLRKKLKKNYGHSLNDRYKVLNDYIQIIKEDISNNNKIIISTVLHKKEMRYLVKKEIRNSFIFYLNCGLEKLEERDYKGRYRDARMGKLKCFPGITEPYEEVDNADFIIDTEYNSVIDSVKNIKEKLSKLLTVQSYQIEIS